jgi:hypothetical protein
VVGGLSPTAVGPTGSPVGPAPTLVVQGLDRDHRRELSLTGPDAGGVLDSALADLVTDADPPRGEEAAGTSGVRGPPRTGDAEDATGPERIQADRLDPAELARPAKLPLRVPPVERGLIQMDW